MLLLVFTGLPCPSCLDTIVFQDKKEIIVKTTALQEDTIEKLNELRKSIYAMHKEVECTRKKQLDYKEKNQSRKVASNFTTGDYVLRSRVDERKHANKMQITWVGPYKIIDCEEY